MALYGVVTSCDVSGFLAQVRPAQGVASVKEEMLQSDDPINKASEEKNPTSANTVPRSLVWNINWTHTSEFTPVSSRFSQQHKKKVRHKRSHSYYSQLVANYRK